MEQIDAIRTQPLQRLLGNAADARGAAAQFTVACVDVFPAGLRGPHDLLPYWREGLANELLVVRAIRLGGVAEGGVRLMDARRG